jgi:hypothetical protein
VALHVFGVGLLLEFRASFNFLVECLAIK